MSKKKGTKKDKSKKLEQPERDDIDFNSPHFTGHLYNILKEPDFFVPGSESVVDTIYKYLQYYDEFTEDNSAGASMQRVFIESVTEWLLFTQPAINMYNSLIHNEAKNPKFNENPENKIFYELFYNSGFNSMLKRTIPDTILSNEDIRKLIHHIYYTPFFGFQINNIALSYTFTPTILKISKDNSEVENFGINSKIWKDVIFNSYYDFRQEEFKRYSNALKLLIIRDITIELEKLSVEYRLHIKPYGSTAKNKKILSLYGMEASPKSKPPNNNEIVENSKINELIKDTTLLKQEIHIGVYYRYLKMGFDSEVDRTKTHRALFNEIVMFVYITIFNIKKTAHIQYDNKGNVIEIALSNGTVLDINEDIDTDNRNYIELLRAKNFSKIFHIEEAFYICEPNDIDDNLLDADMLKFIQEFNSLMKTCLTILRIFIYMGFLHIYGSYEHGIDAYPKNEVLITRLVYASFLCKNIPQIHQLYELTYELSLKIKEIKEKKEEERLKLIQELSQEEFLKEKLLKTQQKDIENRKKRQFTQGDFGDEEDEKSYPAPSLYSNQTSPIPTPPTSLTPQLKASPLIPGEVRIRSSNSPSIDPKWRKFRTVIPSSYMRYNSVSNSCSPIRKDDNDYDAKKAYQCITKYKSYKEEKDPSVELEKRKSFFRSGCVPKECIDRGHISRMRRLVKSNELDAEVENMANSLAEINSELGEIRTIENTYGTNKVINDMDKNLDLIMTNIDSVNIQKTNKIILTYANFLDLTEDKQFEDRINRLKEKINFIVERLKG